MVRPFRSSRNQSSASRYPSFAAKLLCPAFSSTLFDDSGHAAAPSWKSAEDENPAPFLSRIRSIETFVCAGAPTEDRWETNCAAHREKQTRNLAPELRSVSQRQSRLPARSLCCSNTPWLVPACQSHTADARS